MSRLSDELLAELKHLAKSFFTDSKGSHDWDHTLRVYRLCEQIGPQEHTDMDVLRVSALFHDIGRHFQDGSNGRICHAEKGAEMVLPITQRLPLDNHQKDNIVHCIQSHRFRGKHMPRTPEAKVLFDADKLDAIGAVGIARAYLFAGEIGARLHNTHHRVEDTQAYSDEDTGYREFVVKLQYIKDRMLTQTGRQMAQARHGFMESFFQRFIREYEGSL